MKPIKLTLSSSSLPKDRRFGHLFVEKRSYYLRRDLVAVFLTEILAARGLSVGLPQIKKTCFQARIFLRAFLR